MQRRSEMTRTLILAAASEEFAGKGFEGGSMRSIARAAGMELAHVQHHFGDKQSLWSSVIAKVVGSYREEFVRIYRKSRKRAPALIIATFLESLIHNAAKDPTFVSIMSQARTTSSEHAQVFQKEVKEGATLVMALIRKAQKEGTYVEGDPGILFYLMVGAALRIFMVAADASVQIGRSPTDPAIVEEHISGCIALFMPELSRDAIA